MAGLEVLEFAFHSLNEEGDDGSAVVSFLLDYLSQFGLDVSVRSACVSALSPCGGRQVEVVDDCPGFLS